MNIDFSQPAPRVGTLDEAQALIEVLWLLVRDQAALIERQTQEIAELKQRIQVLEEKLNANSRNSSRPPSRDLKKGKPGISARVAGPRLLALMGTLTGGYRRPSGWCKACCRMCLALR